MEGKVAFRDGTVQVVGVGEEYKNAKATVTFQPGGVIKIDDIYMTGTNGELTGHGVVKTRGLALESATAKVNIPKRKPLDLALQGQPLGEVSGDVEITATSIEDGKTTKLQVAVPTLNVALPQKLKAGVHQVSKKTNIRVGVFRDSKTFVRLPLDEEDLAPPKADEPASTVIDVDVRLGEVTIGLGKQAQVVVTGNPHLKIANKTELTGQIVVKRGKIEVQGKSFDIEKGSVTFHAEDPSNPTVVATAGWEADDGSHVYAEFVGPLKTGKVSLYSSPPRPRNEVLAMILFGTADGANAAPPPGSRGMDNTTKAAVGFGGGFATRGLNEAMDDLAGIPATVKMDTTRSANPAPEIEFQLTRRLSIEFAHVLGTPPLSEPDLNLATIDWRIRTNWSLENDRRQPGSHPVGPGLAEAILSRARQSRRRRRSALPIARAITDASARPPGAEPPVTSQPQPDLLRSAKLSSAPPPAAPGPVMPPWGPTEAGSTHLPLEHASPCGHVAPAQASLHCPASQKVPSAHGVAQLVSMHLPDGASHESPAPHWMPPHWAHPERQTPSRQAWPAAHVTPAQRSRQALPTQVCPCGQTTPSQLAAHLPAWHIWPSAQVTSLQPASTHKPFLPSHSRPGPHGNSPDVQLRTQRPWKQSSPAFGHVALSSILPLQSSSMPLHVSGPEPRRPTHSSAPFLHARAPRPQRPGLPVSHASPPPEHSTPSTLVTMSVKSPLLPPQMSSHAK